MIESYSGKKHVNLSPMEWRPRQDLTDQDLQEMSTFSSREALDRAEMLATRDGLTGLENITEFKRHMGKAFESFLRVREKIGQEGKKFRRGDKSIGAISVAIFDIDNFREINEKYGHNAANKVLEAIGGLMRLRERETDSASRFGGDEFAWGFVGMKEKRALRNLKEFQETIENFSVEWEGQRISIAMSFGISSTDSATTLDLAMEQADEALRAAKKAGKNRILRYSAIAKKAQKSDAPFSIS